MEQWNVTEEFYSLNNFLARRYFKGLYKSGKVTPKELQGKTLKDRLKYLELKGVCDFEDKTKYQKEILFKMLDSLIDNSKNKLVSTNKRFQLTKENCIFFNDLLNLYEDDYEDAYINCKESYKALIEKQYHKISEYLIPMLAAGVLGLAKNPKNSVKQSYAHRKLNDMFDYEFKRLYDTLHGLRFAVLDGFAKIILSRNRIDVTDMVIEKLEECTEEIKKIILNESEVSLEDSDIMRINKSEFKERFGGLVENINFGAYKNI